MQMGSPSKSPDPVLDPQGYQQHLLGLLGTDDPSVVQAGTPSELRSLVEESGAELRVRPEPGEWSVLECVGHALDAEIVYAGRYRRILAHDEPPLIGYDQDLWVARLGHQDDAAESQLRAFEVLRLANIELWNRTPVALRGRFGIHAEPRPESFDLSFRLIAGHDRFHLDQARRTLRRVRAT